MRFLANENIPLDSVVYLRNKHHDVLYVGVDHSGITDIEVISLAIKELRTIITFDKDYGELIFLYQRICGVLAPSRFRSSLNHIIASRMAVSTVV